MTLVLWIVLSFVAGMMFGSLVEKHGNKNEGG